MGTIVRPTADLVTAGWLTDADTALAPSAIWSKLDESVIGTDYATTYLRRPTDPPQMVGPGLAAAPHAQGEGTVYAPSTSRYYAVRFQHASVPGTTLHFDYGLVFVPDAARTAPNTSRPCVVYVHGATNTEQQLITSAPSNGMLNDWLSRGWIVVSPRIGITMHDDGTDDNDGKYGNGPTRDGLRAMMAWLTTVPWKINRVLFYGFSMGGVATLNYLRESVLFPPTIPIVGCELVDAVANLSWAFEGVPTPGSSSGTMHGNVKVAYALPNNSHAFDSDWTTLVDTPRNGHDPAYAAMSGFPSIPFRLSCSADDTTVREVPNLQNFKARLDAVPWARTVTITETNNQHGDPTHFDPTATAAFFNACIAGTL